MKTIRIKRVYEAPEAEDGVRVLVDRLWPRGVKKESLKMDLWAKEITPSPELRKLWHGGEIGFAGFSEAYREELMESADAAAFAEKAKKWLETKNVTLLYAAKNQAENHALILSAWLREKTS